MGLDTSHGCWHGPYSMFMRWREWLAAQVGIPLQMMEGFVESVPDQSDIDSLKIDYASANYNRDSMIRQWAKSLLPLESGIEWTMLKGDPLWILLHHSDCDGKIHWWNCKRIAERLAQVYRQSKDKDVLGHGGMDCKRGCYDSMRRATLRFALGCMKAYRAREHITFR